LHKLELTHNGVKKPLLDVSSGLGWISIKKVLVFN